MGSEIDYATHGSIMGKENLKTSGWKNLWGFWWQDELPASQRVHWRDPQGPRTCTNPPTWESAPEGSNLLVGTRGSD